MTCTADVNDPSAANSNIRGSVQLLTKHERKPKKISNWTESAERNLQHSVSFRKLRRSRRVVRLQSGQSQTQQGGKNYKT